MENPIEKKTRFFKGAGFLFGFFIGTVSAVIFVALTGVEALIGAIAAAVGIPVGLALEEKIHGKPGSTSSKGKSLIMVFLVFGFVFLAVLMFLTL